MEAHARYRTFVLDQVRPCPSRWSLHARTPASRAPLTPLSHSFAPPRTPAHTLAPLCAPVHTPPCPSTRAAPSPTISPAVRCGRRRRAPRAARSRAPRPCRTHRTPRRRLRTARAGWRARGSRRRRRRPRARTAARTTQGSSEARRGAALSSRAWTACARRRPPAPGPSAGAASRAARRATPRTIAHNGDEQTLTRLVGSSAPFLVALAGSPRAQRSNLTK